MKNNHVVVFSKSFCPFCLEVKATFAAKRVPIVLIELDKTPNGSKIQAALKAMNNQGTVPNVFIQGEHIGGCDDTKALEASGELDRRVAPFVLRRTGVEGSQVALVGTDGAGSVLSTAMPPTAHKTPSHSKANGKAAAGSQGRAVMPLFYFPSTVNHHVVRLMVRGRFAARAITHSSMGLNIFFFLLDVGCTIRYCLHHHRRLLLEVSGTAGQLTLCPFITIGTHSCFTPGSGRRYLPAIDTAPLICSSVPLRFPIVALHTGLQSASALTLLSALFSVARCDRRVGYGDHSLCSSSLRPVQREESPHITLPSSPFVSWHQASAMGAVSTLIVANKKPLFKPGMPKQFASYVCKAKDVVLQLCVGAYTSS